VSARRPVRVLVVDDSPTVRAVIRRVLNNAIGVTIAGEAADGEAAVAKVLAERPDVVLMDVEMPRLDGFAATERIMALRPTPIVVLTSRANRDHVRTAFEAMRRGAVELLAKPEDPQGWERLATLLPRALLAAATLARVPPARPPETDRATPSLREWVRPLRFVAVGASTGGPAALRELLGGLPGRPPVAILIVQHIAAGFEEGLAEWLASELPLDIRIARDGEAAAPGVVRVAPADTHLHLAPEGRLAIVRDLPPRNGHRPSVDELFLSCAAVRPQESAGVLLTGMGSDGAEGLAALRAAGGLTIVQDERSAVVFGMPRAALELGASDVALPPAAIAKVLLECWAGGA
jgi:two-component system, chemotaxis family, protein-glutamate methylesterase/glutaminase